MKNKKVLFLTLLPLVICCSIGTYNTAALITDKKSLNEDFVSNDVSILKENGDFYFSSNHFKIKIPNFNYYSFKFSFKKEYFADVISFADCYSDVSYCNLSYIEDDKLIKVCFSYKESIYKTTIFDDANFLDNVINNYIGIIDENSYIYNNIITSINAVSKVDDYINCRDNISLTTDYNTYTCFNNNYESKTLFDNIAKDYVRLYSGNEVDNGYLNDDMIVCVIPKELFENNCRNICIGKEYGFFINTYNDPYDASKKVSDILVFDVETLPLGDENNISKDYITTTLKPLFTGRYSTFFKGKTSRDKNNPNLNSIVLKHSSEYSVNKIYLCDIGIRHTLIDRDIKEDHDLNGHYIINTYRSYAATGANSKNGSFVKDTLSFALGFVPYIGDLKSVIEYIVNIYKGITGDYKLLAYNDIIEDNFEDVVVNSYRTMYYDQISDYGHYIKDSFVDCLSSVDQPMLIGVDNNYYRLISELGCYPRYSNEELSVITSYKVNIIQDNTSKKWFFGWHETGYLDYFTSGFGRYNYEYKKVEID